MHLRDWRTKREMTAVELADKLGMSQAGLTRVERGETWPDRKTVEKIVTFSEGEVTASDLYEVFEQTRNGNPLPHGNTRTDGAAA